MSGGSAVKTAVGRGGSPVLAATIGSERRGNAPRRPQGLALTARGPQAPDLLGRFSSGSNSFLDRFRPNR